MKRADILPADALKILEEGNQRFLSGKINETDHMEKVKATSGAQFPFAAILSCIDSRVPAELIFNQGIGDIINIRVGGNIVNTDVLASLEYACKVLNTKLILVLGHTRCGAVESACNQLELGNVTELLTRIHPAIESETSTIGERNGNNISFVNNVSKLNVDNSINLLRKRSQVIRKLEKEEKIRICGAMYEVETGRVIFG